MTSGRSAWCARRVRGSARSSGVFHLILWVLVQIATSREAAKGAKEYTVQRPNFASSHVLPRELIGCHIRPSVFGGWGNHGSVCAPGMACAGRGLAPSPVPTPQDDSHHGPLPGEQAVFMRAATSGPFHLILQVLMQTATSREAAKIAKGSGWGRYTDFASSRSSRELMGCHVKY